MFVGAVGNAFQLAPWADFIAASDTAWWSKYPETMQLAGRKFAARPTAGVEHVYVQGMHGTCNSGVLALECAKQMGATRIALYGFDMHGSHFFGTYMNGLTNTTGARRQVHLAEYRIWAAANP